MKTDGKVRAYQGRRERLLHALPGNGTATCPT